MKEEEKIFAGQFFCPGHPDLKAIKLRCHNLCSAYNATLEDETEKRNAIAVSYTHLTLPTIYSV